MKRNTVSIIFSLLLAFCIALSFSSCFIYASEGKITLKETKTDIKARSVYNRSGYGIVNFEAPVEEEGGSFDWYWYGLLGPEGKYIIEPKPMTIDPLYNTVGNEFFISDGVICDVDKAYYDLSGRQLFDIHFFRSSFTGGTYISDTRVIPFSGGTGLIMYSVNANRSDGGQGWTETELSPIYIVDKSGNILRETPRTEEDYNNRFYYGGDGFLCRNDFTGGMTFYDLDGNLLIDLRGRGYNPYSGIFYNGYAWVRNAETGLCGFVDTSGREVIPCEYEEVGTFCDGLASVKRNGKYGYINEKNEIVIPIEYDAAYGAGGGLAEVCRNGKHGFVDYENKQVLGFEYDDLSSFDGGTAYGIKNGTVYILTEGSKSSVPVPVIAGGSAAVIGIGISVLALIKKARAAAAVSEESAAAGKSVKAAEEAAKEAKIFKPSFGSRSLLISSSDDELASMLKARSFLKVKRCAFEDLEKEAGEDKPDLIITDIGSETELDKMISNKNGAFKDTALSLILPEALLENSRERLEKLVQDGTLAAYVQEGTGPAAAMVKLVLPVLKPDISSDASLGNMGKLADALGIPAVSSLIDAFVSGRDIKATLEEADDKLSIADLAGIMGDLASILGFDRAADIAGLVGDAKNISKALDDESGAYEIKKGVKSMKDILEVLSK